VALSTLHLPSTAAVATAETPEADRAAGAAYSEMVGRLCAAQDAIATFLDRLGATRSTREIGEAKQELEEQLDELHDRYFDALSRASSRRRLRRLAPVRRPRPRRPRRPPTSTNRLLRETQWNVRQDLLVRMDDVEQLLTPGPDDGAAGRFLRRDAAAPRSAVSLLLFAWFAIALRVAARGGARGRRAARGRVERRGRRPTTGSR
jgi:hypothetical protein